MKAILIDALLNEVLMSGARPSETSSNGMLCSIFLLEEDGLHLRHEAASF